MANAPKKDIVANVNKFKAFLKVGKTVGYSLDSIPGTSHVERNIEIIETAEKAIELPIDQLRWSLFWFVNETPIDKIALNHIQSGNIDKAIEIWSKVESVSSLINIIVSDLTQQNWIEAALHADKLFSNYTSAVCSLIDETINLSPQQLMHLFMDTIAKDNYEVLKLMYRAFPECYSFGELSSYSECQYLTNPESIEQTPGVPTPTLPCLKSKEGYFYFRKGQELTADEFENKKEKLIFVTAPFNSSFELHHIYQCEDIILPSKQWNSCIRETLASPYVEKVKAKIATYKAIPKQEAKKRYEFVKSELLHSLQEIYGYLGKESTEYKTLNNQIVKEALQCAIDYYNSLQTPDDVAREIKDFLWTVTITARPGTVLRQRCQENYDTLCDICSKLPPVSVEYYHRLLKDIIDKYCNEASTIQNASVFVAKCFPYLMSIKSVLGASNAYYQRMCTRVAQDALEDIIIDYNEKSKSLHDRLENASSSNRSNIIKLIQEMMKSTVITMYHLKSLALDPVFRNNRFNSNYDIIVKQARNARALGSNSLLAMFGGEVSENEFNEALKKHGPDVRDENGYFSSISSLQDCYTYRRIFPNGKFIKQVDSKVEEYEYQECSTLEDLQKFKVRYPASKYDIESKREEIIFKLCKTIEDYNAYIAKYSTYKKEAVQKIDDLIFSQCKDKQSYEHYLASYSTGGHRLEAEHKLDDIAYKSCKSADDFEGYLKSYPNGCHVSDARKRLEEERLWATCVKKNSWKLYKEYLSKYPCGKHASIAKEKSISPREQLKEKLQGNGCLVIFLLIVAVSIVLSLFTNWRFGVGCTVAIPTLIFIGLAIAGSKNDDMSMSDGCGAVFGVVFILAIIGSLIYGGTEQLIEEYSASKLSGESSIAEFQEFIKSNPNQLSDTQKEKLYANFYRVSLDSCYVTLAQFSDNSSSDGLSGIGYLTSFVRLCKDYDFKSQAESQIKAIADSLYEIADNVDSYNAWEMYQSQVPESEFRDSEKRKSNANPLWSNEHDAWTLAKSSDDQAAYERYLSLYPNGRHRAEADKKIIDMTVSSTFAGEHGSLPEMDKTGYGGGATSYVSVTNSTSYTLTLLYSGMESKRLVLSPNSTGSIRLKNGSYRIAASVSASNVSKYAGTESLNGGSYEVEYYISTTSIPSYRHY